VMRLAVAFFFGLLAMRGRAFASSYRARGRGVQKKVRRNREKFIRYEKQTSLILCKCSVAF